MNASRVHMIVGVDDDFRMRESLQSLVESAGFASHIFASAEDLLDSGKLNEASCLISDIRMPEMNGLELQHRVRLIRPDLPIIFVSGHFNDQLRGRALAGGAFALFDKPFDASDFLEAVHSAATSVRPH